MAASTLSRPPLLLGAAALFLLFAVSSATATNLIRSSQMSVWDELEWNGLPRGLLPDSVLSYTLDVDSRRFEVILAGKCEVQYDYLIQYEPKITGTLNFGSIKELEGVHAFKYFIWFDVSAIEADIGNESVEFEIGYFTQTYPESDFKKIPSCSNDISSLRNAFLAQLQ